MVFLVGMEGWFMVCQILHCHVLHCYTRRGNEEWNKTFSLWCWKDRPLFYPWHFYSLTFCFALWLIRPHIKMRCNKWWKGKVSWRSLRFVCKPSAWKGSKGWGFPSPFSPLSLPSLPFAQLQNMQYFTIIMTRIGIWESLQSFYSSLCRPGFFGGCSLARSIWTHEPHFAMRKESLLVFAHFKVESRPINTLHIMRI